jgi:hypothetical protein
MKRSIAIALSAVMISTTLLSAGCGRKNSNTSNNNNGHIGGSDTSGRNDGIMGEIFDTDGSMGDNNSGDSHSTETTSMPPGETTSDTEKNPAMIKPQGFEDLDFGGKTFVIATQSGTDARWETTKEIYTDEPSAIGTAVRERNKIIELLYN